MTYIDPDIDVESLLPIRAMIITLVFTQPSAPAFFHQAALTAFLRNLASPAINYDHYIRIDACESGRVRYEQKSCYRFLLLGFQGCKPILKKLMQQLKKIPLDSSLYLKTQPFRDNLKLVSMHDAFSEETVNNYEQLSCYTLDSLKQETELWLDQQSLGWQWCSPARLLRDKNQRGNIKGEQRFCRDTPDLQPALLFERLQDTFIDLIHRRTPDIKYNRGTVPDIELTQSHIFWVNNKYKDQTGKQHPMGGLTGYQKLHYSKPLSFIWIRLLILGQFTGVGQRTAFGWGRFQLQTSSNDYSYQQPLAAQSHLTTCTTDIALGDAWRHVVSSTDNPVNLQITSKTAQEWIEPEQDDEYGDAPLETLHENMSQLLCGKYHPPNLKGVVIAKKNGGIRTLAIPPFRDRVLQRTVARQLTPALEQLMHRGSHGYRPGRSRITASYDIKAAWRQGYRWVYESDIEDFFDCVSLEHLEIRLRALFGKDPVIDCIIRWMQAPVLFNGQLIERKNGLPQGSPLSPLMANLILDDFDQDMKSAGLKLIRYADDFVILCKNSVDANAAGDVARKSLEEHGLKLNKEKTRITAMDEGFRYLGYLFVNDMALETNGSVVQNNQETLAPNSWLSQLQQKSAITLDYESSFTDVLKKIANNKPLDLGERDKEGAFICITGAPSILTTRLKHLRVLRDDKQLYDLPWRSIQSIILFGNHQITTQAMHAASQHNTPIHFANSMGNYKAVLWSGQPANQGHQLWIKQVASFSDNEKCLYLSRLIVISRLRHMKESLRRRSLVHKSKIIDQMMRRVNLSKDLEQLRGYEGKATSDYFQKIALILPEQFNFKKRNRRPPTDPFNALLSLGYTLLFGYTESIIRNVGLLPWQGFYHQPRGKHAALASDLMEPFRHIVENTAIRMLTTGQINIDAFDQSPAGACHIKAEARRLYLAQLSKRFETPIKAVGETTPEKLFNHSYNQAYSLQNWITQGIPFKPWRIR